MNGLYREARPNGPAAVFVEKYWYCEDYRVEHKLERRLPSNSFQLIIDLVGNRIPLVVGLPSKSSIIETASLESLVGVVFHPGGARHVFEEPLSEFADQKMDLRLVWGSLASELRERLQAAPTAAGKFAVLDVLLGAHHRPAFTRQRAPLYVIQQLRRAPAVSRIADLANRAGVSTRWLTQTFQQQIGLPPKTYCRILRLQRVLHHPGIQERNGDWARVAADCGYYDQSHFAHEFRDFSGFTVSEFATRNRPWVNHVALE